jgi:Cu(I)/Ag(I) efflux system membrane fusion protein
MHPQMTSDEPGSCPVCGMDLVKRKSETTEGDVQRVLSYRHPHKPNVTSDVPMKDEMGMDYVPVYAGPAASGEGILVSAEVRNNLGVRVAEVSRGLLPRTIRAVGQVSYDEGRVQHVHARAEGWVERLFVSSVGDRVNRGDPLLELYSPRLVTAQEEYLQALRMGGEALIRASETRLRALGISDEEIRRVREAGQVDGRILYRAPSAGVVTRLGIRDGMFVKPDTDMVVLADLGQVWIEADVLARQSAWLARGLSASVKLDQLPGRVRLAFDNPGEALKPNSFATVTISEPDPVPMLIVPLEALIRTSEQTRVIVEIAPNRFAPRLIDVAYESGDMGAIAAGLAAGERVVVSGQFMLDSEANLRGELERISGPPVEQSGGASAQHEH